MRNAFSKAFIVNMSDFCDPHEVVMVLSLLLDLSVVEVEVVGVVKDPWVVLAYMPLLACRASQFAIASRVSWRRLMPFNTSAMGNPLAIRQCMLFFSIHKKSYTAQISIMKMHMANQTGGGMTAFTDAKPGA